MSQRVAKRWPSRSSSRAQLLVVVDLAVLDDVDRPVLVRDRLVAAREVDDREPPRGEPDAVVEEGAVAVGAAVDERGAHRVEPAALDRAPARGDSADPAHALRVYAWGLKTPRSDWPQHAPAGLDERAQVEPHRAVGDPLEVVRELLGHRGLVAAAHLREAGQPGPDDEPLPVAGQVGRELGEEDRPDRPRPDEAHVAAQHVEELRDLVELRRPQPAAEPRGLGARAARRAPRRGRGRAAPRRRARSVRNFSISKTWPPRPTRSPR